MLNKNKSAKLHAERINKQESPVQCNLKFWEILRRKEKNICNIIIYFRCLNKSSLFFFVCLFVDEWVH